MFSMNTVLQVTGHCGTLGSSCDLPKGLLWFPVFPPKYHTTPLSEDSGQAFSSGEEEYLKKKALSSP